MQGGTFYSGGVAICAISSDGLPYILVAIKACVLKLNMCNIYESNISQEVSVLCLVQNHWYDIYFFFIYGKEYPIHC